MGGNIDDSAARRSIGWRRGTLLGPEGTARVGLVSSVPGSGPRRIPATVEVGLVGLVVGLGFGGVFVNWIVDASI